MFSKNKKRKTDRMLIRIGEKLRFAIIPWSKTELNDQLFIPRDLDGRIIMGKCISEKMRDEFIRLGHQVHTIDYYTDLKEVDYFLFYTIDWKLVRRLIKNGWASKMVYCNAEPPTVTLMNTPKGYQKLKRIFPYILTWNENWIDNKSIFKRNIPYIFKENFGNIEFTKKKLLTGISGNKKSDYPDELYSKREEVYTFFENRYPNDFTFYGSGWNREKHPCYGGKVLEKGEVFHQYKFAICFENTKNVRGYITEKIFDCLCNGIIPVYAGADDIGEYLSEECYIDYFRFKNNEQLAQYLYQMDEEEYTHRLEAIKKFLETGKKEQFISEGYTHYILAAVEHKKNFKPTLYGKLYVNIFCITEEISCYLRKFKKRILRKNV